MVTVTINGTSVPLDHASEGWMNRLIADARSNHAPLCIQVLVNDPAASIQFSTPECPQGAGGGKIWNERERRMIDAWNRRGLGGGPISPGDLRAFLNDISRLL